MNSPATRAALVRQTATDFDAAIQAKTFCIEVGAVGKEGFFVEAYGDVLADFDLDDPGNWTSRRLRHNCSKADFELLNEVFDEVLAEARRRKLNLLLED